MTVEVVITAGPGYVPTEPTTATGIIENDDAATGDFNSDGIVNGIDVDLLRTAIINGTSDSKFNVGDSGSNIPNASDFNYLITDILNTGLADGDLNRIIDFDDFVLLANSFGTSPTGWYQGNYNLGSMTDFDDFVVLANNFGNDFGPELSDAYAIQYARFACSATLASAVFRDR